MSGWGASLPAGYLTYERLPLVFDKPSMMGAAVYYAYRREVGGDFGALNAFVERAFRLIQDEKGDMLDPALWRKAAGRSINIKSAQEDAVQAARKTVEYKIKHSPSLIVGGRYIATPNDAGGREDLFVQLANGLASMVLADLGYRA
jgi:thiol:disulfide interchange protein DsbA